jgi:predicted transcriptional regulator
MQLTSRDKEILSFINECGFCVMPQIQSEFNLNFPRNYQVVKRLINEEYISHQQLFKHKHGIYHLTKKGAAQTSLPPISQISLGGYQHQLSITDVRQQLFSKYPDTKWVSERYLKQQKYYYGIGKAGHLADGILIFPDETKIAIEVELSMKGKGRIEKILSAYGGQLEIAEAWYFCAEPVMRPMGLLAKNKSYIKVYSIKEFLHETK